MGKKQRLVVEIKGGELVIRIGIDTLCFAAENCERFYDAKADAYTLKVADQAVFAREVVRALEKEQEDGTTPVHLLLDDAFEAAWEDGCEGLHKDVKPGGA